MIYYKIFINQEGKSYMLEFLNKKLEGFVESDGLASYASRPENSRGRIYDEIPSKTRNDFERDRDRIIYSEAFRKLKFKTQVFIYNEGEHYRTRLSHSMEVAQMARYLARMFHAQEDLAETSALGHDLGHPPFAHIGEYALKECMKDFEGFDHNDQTLRVVAHIEHKYPDFRGLNLTWESLESFIKHNGPVGEDLKGKIALQEISKQADFLLDRYASIEAQIAAVSDDVAYNSHDLEDGLHAGMFTLGDLEKVEWVRKIIDNKRKEYPNVEGFILNQEVIREVMGMFSQDILTETVKRIVEISPNSPEDVRNAEKALVSMSDDMIDKNEELKQFLRESFYLNKYVTASRSRMDEIVRKLFDVFIENYKKMPEYWQNEVKAKNGNFKDEIWHARVVADYIASMTDRGAIITYKKFFGDDKGLLGS